jgi:hypothetical protein
LRWGLANFLPKLASNHNPLYLWLLLATLKVWATSPSLEQCPEFHMKVLSHCFYQFSVPFHKGTMNPWWMNKQMSRAKIWWSRWRKRHWQYLKKRNWSIVFCFCGNGSTYRDKLKLLLGQQVCARYSRWAFREPSKQPLTAKYCNGMSSIRFTHSFWSLSLTPRSLLPCRW